MRIPKEIANHPGVLECGDAEAEGFDGYRYSILLKEGWAWENGRNAGSRSLNVHSVADFRSAHPKRTAV